MASRRLFDGATIELRQLPIVAASLPPAELIVQAYRFISGSWVLHRPYAAVSSISRRSIAKVRVSGEWK